MQLSEVPEWTAIRFGDKDAGLVSYFKQVALNVPVMLLIDVATRGVGRNGRT